MMNVDLRELKPNPTRDFKIDPIDPERVRLLAKSIKEYGFWSGVVCRKNGNGDIEIGAGHTRIEAALSEGITRADVTVLTDIDSRTMMLIYGNENATQRGNQGTARIGTVAAALRLMALEEAELDLENSKSSHGGSRHGIGIPRVAEYLKSIDGINIGTVQQDLASLKQSGEYNRILADVDAELARRAEEAVLAAEREAEEEERRRKQLEADKARKAAEKAKRAAEKAKADAKNARMFDREGVQQYFENPAQLDVFRKYVTAPRVVELLPVDKQADLARYLVEEFRRQHKDNKRVEFSGQWIRSNLSTLLINAETAARQHTKAEKDRFLREDLMLRAKEAMTNFCGACRRLEGEGMKVSKIYDQFPEDLQFPIPREFSESVNAAKEIIDSLAKGIITSETPQQRDRIKA